jgi:glutathione S-transferase
MHVEKGIDVTLKRLRVMTVPKPTRQPDFLAINPRGKTPVFIDTDKDRTKVNESLAILLYIETFYLDRTPLLPPLEQRSYRARILSLIQETENLHSAYDALEDAFFEARDNSEPHRFASTTRPPILKALFAELRFWETYAVQSKKFIGGGEEFTLADCAFYPILAYMLRRGFELDENKWPGLRRYYEAVWDMKSGSAKKAQPEGWEGPGKANVFKGT